jgi:hypothetical protein
MHALMEQDPATDDVYHLEVHFYPVTKAHRPATESDHRATKRPGSRTTEHEE